MWWRAETQSLTRIADRLSTLYVEKSAVDRRENSITIADADGIAPFPATAVATLMLGPGTRITHAAMRLLADSGTSVCWVGENSVRMYAHGVSLAQSSKFLTRQALLVSSRKERLKVARRMYEMRFPGEDVRGLTLQQLRGREGVRVRRAYRLHSSRTGVKWEGRKYVPGKAFEAGDEVNRLLSALNTALYGVCHAAIVGIGASPALGFVHSGSAISFVLDIADLYKTVTTIPAAFDLAAEGTSSERAARLHFRQIVMRENLMAHIVQDIRHLLTGERLESVDYEPTGEDESWNKIIDDGGGEVPGGINYGKLDDWIV